MANSSGEMQTCRHSVMANSQPSRRNLPLSGAGPQGCPLFCPQMMTLIGRIVGITKHIIVGTNAGAAETDKSDMLTERQQRASDHAGKSRNTVQSTC